jgi:hypothetical protein
VFGSPESFQEAKVAGAVETVGKSERFLRRLFQAAGEIIKRISPQATVADFHSYGGFHSASPSGSFISRGARSGLDPLTSIYEEVPQAPTWGGIRVINHFSQEQINDSRSEENPSIAFHFRR